VSLDGEEVIPRWLQALFGRPGLVLACLWGLAEGTLFFVVPDVSFTLVAAFRPARALAHVCAATAGALVAGALMFGWSSAAPERARAVVASVPKVGVRMVDETEARFRARGTPALFDRPLGGVPYKVYAVLAPEQLSLGRFLALSALARLERFGLSWCACALAWWILTRRLPWKLVLGLHPLCWTAVYGYYWSVI
jgi:hypothetical protein